MLPVKADLVILSPVWIVLERGFHVKKMDFSSCAIMPGFGKSSHQMYILQMALHHYIIAIVTPFVLHYS